MIRRLFRRKQNPTVPDRIIASAIAQRGFQRVHGKPYFLLGDAVFGLTNDGLYSFEHEAVLTISKEANLFLTAHIMSLPAVSVH